MLEILIHDICSRHPGTVNGMEGDKCLLNMTRGPDRIKWRSINQTGGVCMHTHTLIENRDPLHGYANDLPLAMLLR